MIDIPPTVAAPLRITSAALERLLVRRGFVAESELQEVLAKAGNRKLIAALCGELQLKEPLILELLSEELVIPVAPLPLVLPVSGTLPEGFNRDFAIRHRCFPVDISETDVTLAVCDPLDFETIQEVEFLLQRRSRLLLAPEGAIVDAIDRHLADPDDVLRMLEKATTSLGGPSVEIAQPKLEEKVSDAGCESPPVVRLVSKILSDAIGADASDIHFVPAAEKLEVMFRIDDVMTTHIVIPRQVQPYVITRIKLLSGMDIAERRRPQDGRFRMRVSERAFRDVRASAVPTPFGEKLALRLLPADLTNLTFDSLGMSAETRTKIEQALTATDQIFIVCGPTGSGKTTTLYAAIRHLHTGQNTIITVEDPIEFRLEGITQIQVDPKIKITFASGLRSILRQDPDVILVGEIRDLETAAIAFQAAQTGHFVLSTLHTNDAPSSIVRLLDLGLEPYLISASLRAVLAQRLVRRVCTHCAEPLPKIEAEVVARRLGVKSDRLVRARGCDHCRRLGYRGRMGLYSFLPISDDVRRAIRERASAEEIAVLGRRLGMQEFHEAARELIEQGLTTFEEAERVLGSAELVVAGAESIAPKKTDNIPASKQGVGRLRKPSSADLASLAAQVKDDDVERPPMILLVDDDEDVRMVLSRVFMREGFSVTDVSGGKEALKVLDSLCVDAIVCDLNMPQVSGTEVLKEVRRSPQTAQTKVMMLTASDQEENEIALIEAGADDFVSKASSPALIVSRLRRLLRI